MKKTIMAVFLASTLASYASAAEQQNNLNKPIILGQRSSVSIIDPKLDDVLTIMPICRKMSPQGRYGIGGESIEIAHLITSRILSGDLNINNYKVTELSRFLICVSAFLKIQNNPAFLSSAMNTDGTNSLNENYNVTYNKVDSFFHAYGKKNNPIKLDLNDLMTAYLLLKEHAQQPAMIVSVKVEAPKLTQEQIQEQIDKNFDNKYGHAVGVATSLTLGKPASEHSTILMSNTFQIAGEHQIRNLTDIEVRQILYWIYEGGTLEDFS